MECLITQPSFDKDYPWRVAGGPTLKDFPVWMADSELWAAINSRQVDFGDGDKLLCDMEIRRSGAPEGPHDDRFIRRVLEHRSLKRFRPTWVPADRDVQ